MKQHSFTSFSNDSIGDKEYEAGTSSRDGSTPCYWVGGSVDLVAWYHCGTSCKEQTRDVLQMLQILIRRPFEQRPNTIFRFSVKSYSSYFQMNFLCLPDYGYLFYSRKNLVIQREGRSSCLFSNVYSSPWLKCK